MATRMQQRRGTSAEWAAANPVLADGELGVEKDTRVIKMGDGTTAWNQLPNLLNGTYLAVNGKAVDADRLDGRDSADFLLVADGAATYQTKAAAADAAKDPLSAATLTHAWEFSGGGGSIPNATDTDVPFTTHNLTGVSRTNNRVTITKEGYYHVSGSGRYAAGGTSGERFLGINQMRNNALVRSCGQNLFTNGAAALSMSRMFRALVGDVFFLNAFQVSGGALVIANDLSALGFSGDFVRPL